MNILNGTPTEKFQDYLRAQKNLDDLLAEMSTHQEQGPDFPNRNAIAFIGFSVVTFVFTLTVPWFFYAGIIIHFLALVGLLLFIHFHPRLPHQHDKKMKQYREDRYEKKILVGNAKTAFVHAIHDAITLEKDLNIKAFRIVDQKLSSIRVTLDGNKTYRMVAMNGTPHLFHMGTMEILQSSYESAGRMLVTDDLGNQVVMTQDVLDSLRSTT